MQFLKEFVSFQISFRRMNSYTLLAAVFLVVLSIHLAWGRPQFESAYDEPVAAETGHHHAKGRVQIKVYRGPTEGHGYHKFAPWGYWVKQPEDDKKHHKHH